MTDAVLLHPDRRMFAGSTLLDRVIEQLAGLGVPRVLVAGEADLAHSRPAPSLIAVPACEDGADTIRQVLSTAQLASDAPFFVIDGNVAWFDGPAPVLPRLLAAFDGRASDGVFLLVRAIEAGSRLGRADLMLDPLGAVRRPPPLVVAPFLAGGVRLLSPCFFEGSEGFDRLRDRAIERERLQGVVHDGLWFDLATDRGLAEAEATLDDRLSGVRP